MLKMTTREVQEFVEYQTHPGFEPTDWRAEAAQLRNQEKAHTRANRRAILWSAAGLASIVMVLQLMPHAVQIVGALWLG